MTTTKTGIHAKQIAGSNAYRAQVNFQGQMIACDHRHATITSARQCADLPAKVRQINQERREAMAAHPSAGTPQEGTMTNRTEDEQIIDALKAQAVDYAAAQDKAYLAEDDTAEAAAQAGKEATIKALALVMGVNEALATEVVMVAATEGRA